MARRPPNSASHASPIASPQQVAAAAAVVHPDDPRRRAERILVLLTRTANSALQKIADTLKPYGLTTNQYNVLRILRGARGEALTCGQIGERMMSHDPDITRLLDRLERAGLVVRERHASDRRVVVTRLTVAGLELLAKLDEPVLETDREIVQGMSDAELEGLRTALDRVLRPVR